MKGIKMSRGQRVADYKVGEIVHRKKPETKPPTERTHTITQGKMDKGGRNKKAPFTKRPDPPGGQVPPGKVTTDYNGYPDGVPKDQISHTFFQKEDAEITDTIQVYAELDNRLIQLQKNLYTKVDEAKAQINRHIDDDHRDDDIYKFLAHTTRGRILCRLFGYKSSGMRRAATKKKKQKFDRKLKQIIEV